jgi:hypothetical protein
LQGETPMKIAILTNHLLITVVAWIGGGILGGGAGYLMAHLVRLRMSEKPDQRRILALLPWRTLIFVLLLAVWSPWLVMQFGLGILTGIVTVGLTIGLVAWPMAMSACLNAWFTSSLRKQLIAEARTLLVFAVLATVGAGFAGGGGAGWYLIQQMDSLEYGKAFQVILWLTGLALILDLTSGIVEYWAGFGTSQVRKM